MIEDDNLIAALKALPNVLLEEKIGKMRFAWHRRYVGRRPFSQILEICKSLNVNRMILFVVNAFSLI